MDHEASELGNIFLPPTNEVWGKAMVLHLFVILFTAGEGVYPSMQCGRHPLADTHPQAVTPGQTFPLPPPILRDTVNKWAVCILLECILVIRVINFYNA